MSQNDLIFLHLKSGKSITPLEALNLYGCFRLSARIKDLKNEGHIINCELVEGENGKRFASYTMVNKKYNFKKVNGRLVMI